MAVDWFWLRPGLHFTMMGLSMCIVHDVMLNVFRLLCALVVIGVKWEFFYYIKNFSP